MANDIRQFAHQKILLNQCGILSMLNVMRIRVKESEPFLNQYRRKSA